MPYIVKTKRERISPVLNGSHKRIESEHIECAGDLNYAFTVLILDYIERKGLNYQILNDAIGVLENCKQELYRRLASDYESKKASENGDVY